jgi:hypothetical protein
MRHVGSPVFAVIVCRKFASPAAISWHLPHHKNAAGWLDGSAGQDRIVGGISENAGENYPVIMPSWTGCYRFLTRQKA